MTVKEALERIKRLWPSQYTDEDFCLWLTELDEKAKREVVDTHLWPEDEEPQYDGPYVPPVEPEPEEDEEEESEGEEPAEAGEEEPEEQTLLIPEPDGTEIYTLWLQAKIDLQNNEWDRYNAVIALFADAYRTWTDAVNRERMPKKSSRIRFGRR